MTGALQFLREWRLQLALRARGLLAVPRGGAGADHGLGVLRLQDRGHGGLGHLPPQEEVLPPLLPPRLPPRHHALLHVVGAQVTRDTWPGTRDVTCPVVT